MHGFAGGFAIAQDGRRRPRIARPRTRVSDGIKEPGYHGSRASFLAADHSYSLWWLTDCTGWLAIIPIATFFPAIRAIIQSVRRSNSCPSHQAPVAGIFYATIQNANF